MTPHAPPPPARTRAKIRSGVGPFDMVFAVGPLTSPAAGGGGADEEAALSPILAGETPPAVPLYFFEAGGSESLAAMLQEDSCEFSSA